jgi:excisionase family DNA binding protein
LTIDTSQLLTIAQAAKRTPYSEPAIRSRIDRGELQATRIGGRVFVTEAALLAAFGILVQPAA